MSQYGREVTLPMAWRPAYVPHGVDTAIFRPPVDRVRPNAGLGIEDRFVVLSDARNQPRKLLPRLLDIFDRFARRPSDVVLHLHCDPADPAARGRPSTTTTLRPMSSSSGLGDKVRFTSRDVDPGRPRRSRTWRRSTRPPDVHLLASWGEGFGLPSLQAAATGVVPLASDYTASRELVAGHGEPIRVAAYVPDQFGIRRALIDIEDAVARLDRLHRDRDLLARKSAEARRFAEAYDWSRLLPQWGDLLEAGLPQARQRMTEVPVSTLRIRTAGRETRVDGGLPADVSRTLEDVVRLPDGASAVVKVVTSQAGRLAAEVMRDGSAFTADELSVPVTLPSADSRALVERRRRGCVHVASAADAPLVWALAKVFPAITVWSSRPIDLGRSPFTGELVRPSVMPMGEPGWRRHLAASVLALDLGGVAPELLPSTAELGVPSIGLADVGDQPALWPTLTLPEPDIGAAARLARTVLTDQRRGVRNRVVRPRPAVCAPTTGARRSDHLMAVQLYLVQPWVRGMSRPASRSPTSSPASVASSSWRRRTAAHRRVRRGPPAGRQGPQPGRVRRRGDARSQRSEDRGADEDLRGERRPPAGEPSVGRPESTAAAILDGPDAVSAARFGAPALARPLA